MPDPGSDIPAGASRPRPSKPVDLPDMLSQPGALPRQPPAATPTQMLGHLNQQLRAMGRGWIQGEITDYRRSKTGHHYFSISDGNASIACAIWKNTYEKASHASGALTDGMIVKAQYIKTEIYKESSRFTLHVSEVVLQGQGQLNQMAQEALKHLKEQGMTARSPRPLPWPATKIAVVAAQGSDAMADVVQSLQQQWALTEIVLIPSTMQGNAAVASIEQAIKQAVSTQCDMVIIARGGGSSQDLSVFDNQVLCQHVYNSAIPTIVAIGHTPDRPNVYQVADYGADVPGKTAVVAFPVGLEQTKTTLQHTASLVENKLRDQNKQINQRKQNLAQMLPSAHSIVQGQADGIKSLVDSQLITASTQILKASGRLPTTVAKPSLRKTQEKITAQAFDLQKALAQTTKTIQAIQSRQTSQIHSTVSNQLIFYSRNLQFLQPLPPAVHKIQLPHVALPSIKAAQQTLANQTAAVAATQPLSFGYAYVTQNGQKITAQPASGTKLTIKLDAMTFDATVD